MLIIELKQDSRETAQNRTFASHRIRTRRKQRLISKTKIKSTKNHDVDRCQLTQFRVYDTSKVYLER